MPEVLLGSGLGRFGTRQLTDGCCGHPPARTENHVEDLEESAPGPTKRRPSSIAHLVDAGELDPDGDVEVQFLDWQEA